MIGSMPPETWIPVAILVIAVLWIFVKLRLRGRVRLERRPLLTRAEVEMLAILRAVLPDHHIGCQVSMGALLAPRRGLNRKARSLARNKVSQKVVDFVVIDPRSGHVEAVIELDDSTHDAGRDAARDALLAQGGYAVIRIPSKPRPTVANVRPHLAKFRG